MRYSIERICRNIQYNLLGYIVLVVGFTLGVSFLYISMDFQKTSAERLQESKRQSADGVIPVVQYITRDWEYYIEREEYAISYDTYLSLSTNEKYTNEIELLFSMGFSEHFLMQKLEDAVTLYVYYMNDNLFQYLYEVKRNSEIVYLGKSAYEKLLLAGKMRSSENKSDIIYIEAEMYIDNNLFIMNGVSYPFEVIFPVEDNTIMPDFMGNTGYDMAEAIIFPIEVVTIPEELYSDFSITTTTKLFFRYLNDDFREDIVAQQLRELNKANRDYNFEVTNEYLELKREMDDYKYEMDRWMFVAMSIIALMGVGSIGLMYLILDKRRHYIAVSMAYGSTLNRIKAETIVEIGTVLILGCWFGMMLKPVLKEYIVYQDELRYNPIGVCVAFVLAVLFSIVSVLLSVYGVRIKEVVITLKEG